MASVTMAIASSALGTFTMGVVVRGRATVRVRVRPRVRVRARVAS